MAEAAGHRFGQAIGEFCESALAPLLRDFAKKHGLYLDTTGPRPARSGKKLRWLDSYGNAHDLDFVLERGGTPEKIGTPVAFIESAWRRYTKHSKNKAQEIQGAVLPIADRHRFSAPMLGCVLAGEYTAGALKQLQSHGFKVLFFSYDVIRTAFQAVGVDAQFDEATPDHILKKKMQKWSAVSVKEKVSLREKLLELNRHNVQEFMTHLERAVERQISSVRIIPLHGASQDCISVQEAIGFIIHYDETAASGPLMKYEVLVRYDNGDKIEATFSDRAATIEFLAGFQQGNWTPALDLSEEKAE
jgi:hypothetical protein